LTGAIVAAGLLVVMALGSAGRPSVADAASPTPTPAQVGDPRSSGEGAGLVGSPLVAIGGMVAVGLLAAGGTLLYVRLTGGPGRD
jgi:hypothetical protein